MGHENVEIELNKFRPCSLGRRLMVMVYDTLVVIALLLIAAAAVLPLGGEQSAGKNSLYTLYLLLVWFSYLGWCWTRGGQTLGMRTWKVRLTGTDKQSVTTGMALARFAVSLLSAVALGLGFWWSLFDRQKRCWHDMASNTCLQRTDSD